jgi:hypothetical protein
VGRHVGLEPDVGSRQGLQPVDVPGRVWPVHQRDRPQHRVHQRRGGPGPDQAEQCIRNGGFQSDTNANDRWPNVLARRLDAIGGSTLSVVDEGISGNQVLTDSAFAGVSALNRLTRDVLDQPGAKVVILLEGINDIGFTDLGFDNPPATAASIEAGYEQPLAC